MVGTRRDRERQWSVTAGRLWTFKLWITTWGENSCSTFEWVVAGELGEQFVVHDSLVTEIRHKQSIPSQELKARWETMFHWRSTRLSVRWRIRASVSPLPCVSPLLGVCVCVCVCVRARARTRALICSQCISWYVHGMCLDMFTMYVLICPQYVSWYVYNVRLDMFTMYVLICSQYDVFDHSVCLHIIVFALVYSQCVPDKFTVCTLICSQCDMFTVWYVDSVCLDMFTVWYVNSVFLEMLTVCALIC